MFILILDKIDFKSKLLKETKKIAIYVLIGSTYQEDIIVINIYAPNNQVPNYTKQTLVELKGEIVLQQ